MEKITSTNAFFYYLSRYFTKKRVYYSFVLIILSVILIAISLTTYFNIESIIAKNAEINQIFEKWLIVKNETVKYINYDHSSSPPQYDKATHYLIASVSDYEISMEKIIDKKFLSFTRNKNHINDEIAKMILFWQDIQFKIVLSIFYSDDINLFINEIFHFITETDEFEVSMKKTLRYIENYLYSRMRLYWILFSVSIFLSFFILLLFSNLTYNYSKILEKEKKIRKLSKSIIKIRDNERTRIAVDLHDVIVQNLFLLKHNFVKHFQSKNTGYVNLKNLIEKIIISVRDISFNLRPIELSENLEKTLKAYCEDVYARTGIEIDFFWIGMGNYKIEQDLEITIYRILNEAINNVIKHANASKVVIRIILSYPYIKIKIEDNGKGFIYDEKNLDKNHMGLHGMKERVNLLDGDMKVRSVQNIGTFITFDIPCRDFIYEVK